MTDDDATAVYNWKPGVAVGMSEVEVIAQIGEPRDRSMPLRYPDYEQWHYIRYSESPGIMAILVLWIKSGHVADMNHYRYL